MPEQSADRTKELVLLMTQHPVELLRRCAHEALHALLDCLDPADRLAILSTMVQVGGRGVYQHDACPA